MIKALLTDIEGTTSSISFVKDVLFPYSREHLAEFVKLRRSDPQVRKLLDDARALAGSDLSDMALIEQLLQWIDEDRKSTPLKSLQGLIWEHGYQHGDFHGHIYEDAVRCLRTFKAKGLRLYVYSSGSVHAQKLLFAHTQFGDLTPLFSGYFDTHIGPKQAAESYGKIAASIGLAAGEILFLSDVEAELDAARTAGLVTLKLVREGVLPPSRHPQAADFDAVCC
ncbi:MAG: acireductone synthase [Gammaproteobacteria bacterium]|nr:acireductone synthase [Gammaproteobacteria bacterium]